MSKKPIDRLYGLPSVLIMLLLLAKYVNIFPVPNWLLSVAITLGAVTFFWDAMVKRKREGGS